MFRIMNQISYKNEEFILRWRNLKFKDEKNHHELK